MYHVSEATSSWHVKCIDVHLAEEHTGPRYNRWNIDMMEVSGLTDVARVCKPFDIHTHVGPPEALYKVRSCGIRTSVSYLIVRLSEKLQVMTWRNDNLVFTVCILAP